MDEEQKSGWRKALDVVVYLGILLVIVHGGIAMFGDWFQANKTILKDTRKAQENIRNALLLDFNDTGRLDVRYDYSVLAYISKKNYMVIPYPDRDKAITRIGKAWCENEGVNRWYMPKVVFRDIQTGEEFGSYRCLFGYASQK